MQLFGYIKRCLKRATLREGWHIKKYRLLLIIALIVCLMSSCEVKGASIVTGLSEDAELRMLQDLRNQYREASLVAVGECIGSYADASGETINDIRITEVLAGDAAVGDIVHCLNNAMQPGQSYMVYLKTGEDVYHAEDEKRFELLGGDPILLVDNELILGNSRISLNSVKTDVAALDSVINNVPQMYYYEDLRALVDASDEIFIGKVNYLPNFSSLQFNTRSNGASIESKMPACVATIISYGSIKGALNYSDQIKLVYSPAMVRDVLDDLTLTAFSLGKNTLPKLSEEGVYLFFLVKGPDEKQNYYFPINPVEGYVELMGNKPMPATSNELLSAYDDLSGLVTDIKNVMNQRPYAADTPLDVSN